MKTSKKAESFAGIIVWVFILSFVMLGIINILIFSTDVTAKYNETNRIEVLKQNLTNVVQKIDTSMIQENEIFYLHRNTTTGEYQIFTGATNENYKYIDEMGNTIADIVTYEGDIYSQILWMSTEDISFLEKNQIIRASIKKLARSE